MSARRGRVEGKVALVTGGNGGIGQKIALRLGEEGARVVLGDLDESAEVLEWLAGKGVEAMAVTLDVRDEASWQQAVAQTLARFGTLDVLVNNAGIALPPPDGFEAITLADWRRVMSVNLDGVFLGMKQAVLAMRERGGSIVNIGSVAAYVGTPGGAAYGASKGALRTLAKQAAVACATKGYKIRINTVHPMYIWTPLLQTSGKSKDALRDLHPFKQLGEPDDVAYAVLYLASDESRLVNGADLVVDGAQLST
jgi:3(or 17)beta-hydroxysteroid dehydrogenase